jgi:cyclic pyranopterin phosphate synthase
MTLTHLDEQGRARMVDVGEKADTERIAVARGEILMRAETLSLIRAGGIEKGDVLAVARVAGIMGAKKTSELIPMCHPLLLTNVQVDFELPPEPAGSRPQVAGTAVQDAGVVLPTGESNALLQAIAITATVKSHGKTGVEMEALTAVSVAALTIYDMAKAVDRAMRIQNVRLASKRGGKSGDIILES